MSKLNKRKAQKKTEPTKTTNYKPENDNLELLFSNSWNTDEPEQVPVQVPVQEPVQEPVQVPVPLPMIVSVSEQKNKRAEQKNEAPSNLTQFLSKQTRNQSYDFSKSENFDEIMQNISSDGKQFILDCEEEGVNISGIESKLIITKWDDLKNYIHILPIFTNNPRLCKNLYDVINSVSVYGFSNPKLVQGLTIGTMISRKDMIIQACANNGKTAAFGIACAATIDTNKRTQVIIIAHTGELAKQTYSVLLGLTSETKIIVHLEIAGARNNTGVVPHIIVGTVGRIQDFLTRPGRCLDTKDMKTVIFDEADKLLTDFYQEITCIIQCFNIDIQICAFSATFPSHILTLFSKIMCDPAFIILPENKVMTTIVKQWCLYTSEEKKFENMLKIFSNNPNDSIIVFFNSCSAIDRCANMLKELPKQFSFVSVHSHMDTDIRNRNMASFIDNKKNILLSTDLLARGIDVTHVTIVINYNLPFDNNDYIHRVGRAGRGAKTGTSITFVSSDQDKGKLSSLVNLHQVPIHSLKSDHSLKFTNNNM